MEKLTPSKLTKSELKCFINLQEKGIDNYDWLKVDSVNLSEEELQQLNYIKSHLLNYSTHLMNEATIWARAIYPFLLLAETGKIQAWAAVFMEAKYNKFEIEGIADGVLGKSVSSSLEAPYLVVVEAKRGLEAQNPVYQLYAQMLMAAHFNWEDNQEETQEIYGCYTIADVWTFVRGKIESIESEYPVLTLEYSREYTAKIDAEFILKILKKIIANYH